MAQLKSTSVVGNLAVTGNVVASSFIKLDGGINDILFADGSTYNYTNSNADWYYNSGRNYSSWNIGKKSKNGIFTLHKDGGFIDIQVSGTPNTSTPFIIPSLGGRAAVFNIDGLQNASSETNKIIIATENDILQYRTVNQFRADLKLAQVYDYKGTLDDIDALKEIASAKIGDTYFISSTGESWSCTTEVKAATNDNYTNHWSSLGNTVDLDGYMTLNTNQTITGQKTFDTNLILTHTSASLITRSDSTNKRTAGIYSNDTGDAVLGILVQNPSTHIMLGQGDATTRPQATSLTPAIDIKNNKVGINKRLGTDNDPNADAGKYNLDVNGSLNATIMYLSDSVNFQYNTDDKCIDIIFN